MPETRASWVPADPASSVAETAAQSSVGVSPATAPVKVGPSSATVTSCGSTEVVAS